MTSGSTSSLNLYEITDLALLGEPDMADDPARFLVTSPFQSLPFRDSVTNLTQARARWLDHHTGTFLSPDPMGYRDSANLYAYCGGDPVNGRDPTGLESLTSAEREKIKAQYLEGLELCRRDPTSPTCIGVFGLLLADHGPQVIGINVREYPAAAPLGFVNGVLNTRNAAIGSARNLSSRLQRPVDLMWNPTATRRTAVATIIDSAQAFFVNMAGESDVTTIRAARHFRARVRELRPGDYYEVVAHSQGSSIAAAALNMLTPAERAKINLTTYGEIVINYAEDLHSVRRVINIYDPIAMALSGASPLHPTPRRRNETREYIAFIHHGAHPLAGYLEEVEEVRKRSAQPLRLQDANADWVNEYNRAMGQLTTIPVR